MPALPPKTDIEAASYVRFVPKADIQDFVLTIETPGRYSGALRSLFTDYFGASGPTNLRPLGPVPLTWINVRSSIST